MAGSVLSPAEFEQIRLEDRRQRARADHRRLVRLGVVARSLPVDGEVDLEDAGPLDHDCLALLTAIAELLDEWSGRAFNPAEHTRIPKGQPGGGRFRSMVDRLKLAIEAHVNGDGDGHPFEGFNREQLRKVAKTRGIALKRGEDRDSIAAKLLDHLKGEGGGKSDSGKSGSGPKVEATPAPPPPKKPSVNPVEVTGRNDQWWKVLREDTGMTPVPVRDLELVGGYTITSGKAYRIDGITFIVEDGTGPRDAKRVVEEFQEVHRSLPPEADQYQRGYAWLAGRNPADAYWAKKYDMPDFESAATAGDGAVRMWGRSSPGTVFGPASHMDSLMHEFGHNVSRAVGDRGLDDHGTHWAGAVRLDARTRRPTDIKYTGPLAFRARTINFQRRGDRPYPLGVSNYGTSSPAEDYAESMAFYLGGKIGTGRLKPGGPEVPIYFRDLFPERAKVLDQVFPEVAKRQLAAISSRWAG